MIKEVLRINDDSLYIEMREIERIGNEAIMKAKEENKRYGIPEFFYKNGVIYYQLENGELTTQKPKILQ